MHALAAIIFACWLSPGLGPPWGCKSWFTKIEPYQILRRILRCQIAQMKKIHAKEIIFICWLSPRHGPSWGCKSKFYRDGAMSKIAAHFKVSNSTNEKMCTKDIILSWYVSLSFQKDSMKWSAFCWLIFFFYSDWCRHIFFSTIVNYIWPIMRSGGCCAQQCCWISSNQ